MTVVNIHEQHQRASGCLWHWQCVWCPLSRKHLSKWSSRLNVRKEIIDAIPVGNISNLKSYAEKYHLSIGTPALRALFSELLDTSQCCDLDPAVAQALDSKALNQANVISMAYRSDPRFVLTFDLLSRKIYFPSPLALFIMTIHIIICMFAHFLVIRPSFYLASFLHPPLP